MPKKDWNPGEILEISGYYWKTCTLHAAVKLGIFTVLGDDMLSAGEMAEKLGADADAVERLLNALSGMELLEKRDGKFRNTEGAQAFLVKKAPGYVGHMIMHHQHLVESWNRLAESVTTGEPMRERMSVSIEEWRESFLMGMFNLASNLAPRLVPEIDLSGRKRLLDLGGGPGTYAIHFCIYNQNLRGTVYDLPTTRPFMEHTVERFGLSDRIDFQSGDYTKDAIGGTYDAVWMSHILHGESPGDCRKIVGKAARALSPGGLIVVHDFILNDTEDGPLFPTLFSLNMLLATNGGRAYSEFQIREMLSEAGAKDIRRIPVNTPNDSGVVLGTVG